MLDLTWLARQVQEQKKKYHAKVLSGGALFNNWLRMMDVEDLTAFYIWLNIPEFTYAGLAMSFLFDIPLSEIIPANWDFEVEMPDLDELLEGILVDIIGFDWSNVFEWMDNIDKMIDELIDDQYQDDMKRSRLEKAVYGVSKFNRSYYDPPVIREAIRSTFHRLWFQRRTVRGLIADHELLGELARVRGDIAKYIFDRISMVVYQQPSGFTLGYSLLGHSFLGEPAPVEGERQAVLRSLSHEGEVFEWRGNSLDHAQIGMVLGVTPLGFGFMLPRDTVYKKPGTVKRDESGTERIVKQPLLDFVRARGEGLIRKMPWNPLSFGNYNRPEERSSYLRSERADQYMALQTVRYKVEHMVDPVIRMYESNPVKIRMYKSAALQLLSLPYKRHTWGMEAFKAMSEEELVEWWKRHWEEQGLKTEVLEAIYERLKRWLPEWRAYKLWLGRRVREARYRLARLLRHRNLLQQ